MTAYTSAVGSLYVNDYCSSNNLLLEGTEDVGTLADVVTAFSDGYKATSSFTLE